MAFQPEQTPADIEAVREIALLSSYQDAAAKLAALEPIQWTATREDIAAWAAVKNKHTKIEGDGVKIDKALNRLDIRNRVRTRFGLAEVDGNGNVIGADLGCGFSFSGSVKKKVTW